VNAGLLPGDEPWHDHDDVDQLRTACPGCVVRVQRDQEDARWNEAPLRRCTFRLRWPDLSDVLELVAVVRVPAGTTDPEIADRYDDVLAPLAAEALGDRFVELIRYRVKDVVVGPVVDQPAPVPDAPSLFEVLS
jgi:hypothetical protein